MDGLTPLTGTRKAAILLTSLDAGLAAALLAQLPPDEEDRLKRAAAELGPVTAEEREAVRAEFFRIGPPAPIAADTAPPDGESALRPSVAAAAHAPQGSVVPFGFLRDHDCRRLAPLLEREHPQTIAAVLAHLPHAQAADLLLALPEHGQAEVIARLADLDAMDPDSLAALEQGVRAWLARHDQQCNRLAVGRDAVRGILAAAPTDRQELLLANLHRHDARLARQLADRFERAHETTGTLPGAFREPPPPRLEQPRLDFEGLADLPDTLLAELVRGAAGEILLAALAAASPRTADRFLQQLPSPQALALRRQLDARGPTRLSDVEEAQAQLVAEAVRLVRAATDPARRRLSVAA